MVLTNREKVLLTVLAFVLILGAFIYFLIFPMVDKIKTNSKILEEDRITLANLEHANETGSLTDKEKEIQEEIIAIEKVLPSQVRIPEIFLEILKIADDIGIDQDSFTMQSTIIEEVGGPAPSQEGEGDDDTSIVQSKGSEKLLILPVNHIVKGTYKQLKDYILSIQNSKRKIDLVEYQLSGNNEDDIISATFLLQSYALVKDDQNYSEFVDYDFMTGAYGKDNPFATSTSPKAEENEEDEGAED